MLTKFTTLKSDTWLHHASRVDADNQELAELQAFIASVFEAFGDQLILQDLSTSTLTFNSIIFAERNHNSFSRVYGKHISEDYKDRMASLNVAIGSYIKSTYIKNVGADDLMTSAWEATTAIETDVIDKFAQIKSVRLISKEGYLSETIFSIFIESHVYSDKLMDTLLDKELEILDKYDAYKVTFRYIPFVSLEVAQKNLPNKAKFIFKG